VLTLLVACAPTLRMSGPAKVVRGGARAPIYVATNTPPPPPPEPPAPEPPPKAKKAKGPDPVAVAAKHYLKNRPPSAYRADCSGFVDAVYARAGMDIQGNTRSYWAEARSAGAIHKRKSPAPGDLVFFDNTYDRDKDGRLDDELTHVGVVLDVDSQGTIRVAHDGTSKGRTILFMNLRNPSVASDNNGNVLNSYLRRRTSGDRAGTKYLAGELFRGFATWRP